ncbi:MAG: glycosyltransferase [Chitinophagaceae bacterium]|nr:MAG: glycosyltransferase [Chitinophagaceae bacterium]
MNAKRNILVLLTPGFAASEADSSCLPMLQALVRALVRKAPTVEIRVLALHYPFEPGTYELFGATVQAFGGRNRGGFGRWQRARAVRAALDSLHHYGKIAGIISCWYGEAADHGSSFAGTYGVPHYCWMLGQDARVNNPWPRRLQLPGSALVALSASIQAQCASAHGVSPRCIIEPGVEAAASLLTVERACLLLGVGSLIPLKRWTVFLQVAAALMPAFPKLRVIVTGAGPELARLQALSTRLGLDEVVTFAGALPHQDVLTIMQQARLLLHPSEYEGYSGVCQEALSVGTPVVSFCAPHADLPAGWTWVKTIDEMIQQASLYLNNPDGVKPVVASIDECAQRWLEIFGLHRPDRIVINPEAIASGEKLSLNR